MTDTEVLIGALMLFGLTGLLWWLIVGIVRDRREHAEIAKDFKKNPVGALVSWIFTLGFVAFLTFLCLSFLGVI